MSKRLTDKETSTTARSRILREVAARSADKGVTRWGAVNQFSGGGDRFDPSFRKAGKVRFMKVDENRQGCGVKRVKNGTNVEGADCEI